MNPHVYFEGLQIDQLFRRDAASTYPACVMSIVPDAVLRKSRASVIVVVKLKACNVLELRLRDDIVKVDDPLWRIEHEDCLAIDNGHGLGMDLLADNVQSEQRGEPVRL